MFLLLTASLKVLTSYRKIGGLNLDYELNLAINNPDKSQVVQVIENAKRIAYDCIIPRDFDRYYWKELTPVERFYVKGLEAENITIIRFQHIRNMREVFNKFL